MNKHMRAALVAIAVPALLVAACGGGSSKPKASGSPSASGNGPWGWPGNAKSGYQPPNEPDVNKDGKVVIGILSPGDTHDHGYYESFVDEADAFAKSNGWKIVTVDKINPADAATQATNMCRQHVDMVAVAASELKDAIPVASQQVCKGTVWYVAGGQGVTQTAYFVQTTDDVNEDLYAAGYAAGLLMKGKSTKAGYITGPQYSFATQAAKAFKVGIQAVVPSAQLLSTYTGDFNDSAKAAEAANAQLSQGVGVIYPYLGGATDAVAKLANKKNVPVLTPGTDQCSRTDVKFAISVIFSPGDYFAYALKLFHQGQLKVGYTRVFKMGVDAVPTVKICNPTDSQQQKVDQIEHEMGTGQLNTDKIVNSAK